VAGGRPGSQTLEASEDGRKFRTLLNIPSGREDPNVTFTFPPETSQVFPFHCVAPAPQPAAGVPVCRAHLSSEVTGTRQEFR